MSADNTCSVCLEPLLSVNGKEIGVAVPCGHCYHEECFTLWRASQGPRCKCPLCNIKTNSFVKLYISQVQTNDDDDNDDDISLNSTDSTATEEYDDDRMNDYNKDGDKDEDEGGDKSDGNNELDSIFRREDENGGSRDDDDDDDCQIVEQPVQHGPPSAASASYNDQNAGGSMVDLTLSPHARPPTRQISLESSDSSSNTNRKRGIKIDDSSKSSRKKRKVSSSSPSSSNDSNPDETQRLSKIAKKYKRRWKQQQSQLRGAIDQQTTLRKQLDTARFDLESRNEDMEEMKNLMMENHIELDGVRMQNVRLERDLNFKELQHKSCLQELKTVQSKLKTLQENYNKDVNRAGANSMVELRELAAINKKLQEENQRYKNEQGKYQRKDPPTKTKNVDDNYMSTHQQSQQKKSSKFLKALRQMDDEVRPRGKSSESSTSGNNGRKGLDMSNMTKYSAQSARFAKKLQQKRDSAGGISNNNVKSNSSSMWDNIARKEGGVIPPLGGELQQRKRSSIASSSSSLGSGRHTSSAANTVIATSINMKKRKRLVGKNSNSFR